MSKSVNCFVIAEKKSAKFIIKSTESNPFIRANATIAHCYPTRAGFRVYLHENARELATKAYKTNERYAKKKENPEKYKSEHFCKVYLFDVDRTKSKDIAKTDLKAIENYMSELNARALEIVAKREEKASAKSENADKSPA